MPTFEPPIYESPMRTLVKPLVYFRLTESQSVVRINGQLTTVKSPSGDQILAAGKEGVDWFLGGHIYDVTNDSAVELENAGYVVSISGYGNGAYGYGAYGA